MAAGAVPVRARPRGAARYARAAPGRPGAGGAPAESLELLDMHHDRAGDLLTVTGTVRVRGRDTAPVTAVVTGRDAPGRVVASAHAPLDDAALDSAASRRSRCRWPTLTTSAAIRSGSRRRSDRSRTSTGARSARRQPSHHDSTHSLTRRPAPRPRPACCWPRWPAPRHAQDGFRFKSGVDLVNVTATVADESAASCRRSPKDDFAVFENGLGRRSRTSATTRRR
jgi:hypothetical protein